MKFKLDLDKIATKICLFRQSLVMHLEQTK